MSLPFVAIGFSFLVLASILVWQYQVRRDPLQARFSRGRLDASGSLPSGQYRGSASRAGTWRGKKFDGKAASGINVFEENGTSVERYTFALSFNESFHNGEQRVIRLDYNQPGNPWWLRLVVDEIVLESEHRYVGKLYVRFPFGPAFALGFFELEAV